MTGRGKFAHNLVDSGDYFFFSLYVILTSRNEMVNEVAYKKQLCFLATSLLELQLSLKIDAKVEISLPTSSWRINSICLIYSFPGLLVFFLRRENERRLIL